MPLLVVLAAGLAFGQQKLSPEKEAALKAEVATHIDGIKKQAQVMVDAVFSFGELGFQEFETSRYLTSILEKEGFRIERGIAGIPTAKVQANDFDWAGAGEEFRKGLTWHRASRISIRLSPADQRRRASFSCGLNFGHGVHCETARRNASVSASARCSPPGNLIGFASSFC
jgi:hypothetical protein